MKESNLETVFVTGGTGLVGTHLLIDLAVKGITIRALKRTNSNLSVVQSVFDYYDQTNAFQNIEWVEGDLNDVSSLVDAIGPAQRVFHAAALVSFDPRDREQLITQNIIGTTNLVNACLEKQVEKLCYVSSTAAVGKTKEGNTVVESNEWDEERVNSNYAISKHYAENEVWRGVAEGLPAVIVNPCVIIGPGDLNRSSGTLFKTVKNGLKFYTSGANAFVDARDVSEVMIRLMNSEITNERFLLIGENLSYLEMFTKVANALSVNPPSILVKGWLVEIYWRIEKVKSALLGKKPVVTKESSESATSVVSYSSQKAQSELGYQFRTVDDAVLNAAKYFKLSF